MDDDKQLYKMCWEGNMQEVRMALARGGDPNKKLGPKELTAVHVAAIRGHQEVVADNTGSTALHCAVCEGHQEVVALLLKQIGIVVHAALNNGVTALHVAAGKGHEEILTLLIEQPAIDAKATEYRGFTILHSACYGTCGPDILSRLLTNPDTDPNVKNLDGRTPIMILLQMNYDIDIQRGRLQALVASDKVDLDVKDPQGRSLEDLVR